MFFKEKKPKLLGAPVCGSNNQQKTILNMRMFFCPPSLPQSALLTEKSAANIRAFIPANVVRLFGSQVSTLLDLESYKDRQWEIQACSAVQGLGLQQAFLSVHKMIKKS